MGKYASKVVAQAQAWVGKKESDGSHKEIIDIYNSYKPLPRGYKVQYDDAWCATTTSAIAIKLGYTDIIPVECSCSKIIEKAKAMGIWVEDESKTPKIGWFCVYDWDDDGKGDNKGDPEHIGVVTKVSGKEFVVIEGNYSNSVKPRTLEVNGKYLRGFVAPKYDAETKAETKPKSKPAVTPSKPAVAPSKKSDAVLKWQKAAIADGFKFPKYGADGEWGAECESVASNAVVRRRTTYKFKNLTKIVQKAVGVKEDGLCGANTEKAIREFQKANGLAVDGHVGVKTWKKILKVC